MDGADPTPTPSRMPAIVIKPQPEGGKQRAAAKLILSLAIFVLIVALIPLTWTVLRAQNRNDKELDCRNRISAALDRAQAKLTAEQARTVVILGSPPPHDLGDNLIQLQHDIDNVDALGDIRGQAVSLCNGDPSYTVPAELTQEVP